MSHASCISMRCLYIDGLLLNWVRFYGINLKFFTLVLCSLSNMFISFHFAQRLLRYSKTCPFWSTAAKLLFQQQLFPQLNWIPRGSMRHTIRICRCSCCIHCLSPCSCHCGFCRIVAQGPRWASKRSVMSQYPNFMELRETRAFGK